MSFTFITTGSPEKMLKAELVIHDGDLDLNINGHMVLWIDGKTGQLHRKYHLPKDIPLPKNGGGQIEIIEEAKL